MAKKGPAGYLALCKWPGRQVNIAQKQPEKGSQKTFQKSEGGPETAKKRPALPRIMHTRFPRATSHAPDRAHEAKLARAFLIFPPAKAFNEREKRKEIRKYTSLRYSKIT